MSNTPRTDSFYDSLYHPSVPKDMRDAVDSQERSFAATLERELIEALADASSWEQQASDRVDDCIQQINRAERAERDLATAQARIAELESENKAMHDLMNGCSCPFSSKGAMGIKVMQEIEAYTRELLKQRLSRITEKQEALFYRVFPGTVPADKLITVIDLFDRTIAAREKSPERSKWVDSPQPARSAPP